MNNMSVFGRHQPLLSPEDTSALLQVGHLELPYEGYITLHKQHLPGDFHKYDDAEPPVFCAKPNNDDNFRILPSHLCSKEAFMFVGFTAEAASSIVEKWQDDLIRDEIDVMNGGPNHRFKWLPDPDDDFEPYLHDTRTKDLMAMAMDYITNTGDDVPYDDKEAKWPALINEIGLDSKMYDDIMSPFLRQKLFRGVQSCKDVIREVVLYGYNFLTRVSHESKQRTTILWYAAGMPKRVPAPPRPEQLFSARNLILGKGAARDLGSISQRRAMLSRGRLSGRGAQ